MARYTRGTGSKRMSGKRFGRKTSSRVAGRKAAGRKGRTSRSDKLQRIQLVVHVANGAGDASASLQQNGLKQITPRRARI